MQQNLINGQPSDFLVGNANDLEYASRTPVLKIFSDVVVEFLDALSKEILGTRECKQYSDVIAYAFWIRKASIKKVAERFENKAKLGRGIAFHIAPSNVAVNFAVSMTSSLLAGNISVVRVSDKPFRQVDLITTAMNNVLCSKAEFESLKKMIFVLRYGHCNAINEYLSSICDIRIVWGGNQTVEFFRKFSLLPRAIELTFPDRHSIAIINSESYLEANSADIAEKFYIDTYFTDQNACSSPRLVVWTGVKVSDAQQRFWKEIEVKLKEKQYQMPDILAIDKIDAMCNLAAKCDDLGISKCGSDNLIFRVSLKKLSSELMHYKMSGGYFFEYHTNDLSEITCVLDKKCQTISYLGIDPELIRSIVIENGVRGVDRIVPLGKTMELEFFWDGLDMIDAMSRYVDVL